MSSQLEVSILKNVKKFRLLKMSVILKERERENRKEKSETIQDFLYFANTPPQLKSHSKVIRELFK